MRHITKCLIAASRHPRLALKGVREFRSSLGLTFLTYDQCNAYDAGRELAHIATFRKYDFV